MNLAYGETAAVEISASHPRFAVPMYAGTKVHVEIDSDVSIFPWGRHSIPVSPGRHYVTVFYRGFNNHGNPVETWLNVEPGATAHLTYQAPKFGGQQATLECDSAIPEPDDLPKDLRDSSDAQLLEAWSDFDKLGGGRLERFLLRKMRAEFQQEIERRGLSPESVG